MAVGATGLAPTAGQPQMVGFGTAGDREDENVGCKSRTLSRDEVVRSERRAWADADSMGGRVYVYDGINFWCRRGRSEPQPAAPWRTPQGGWRHRVDCGCERCAS